MVVLGRVQVNGSHLNILTTSQYGQDINNRERDQHYDQERQKTHEQKVDVLLFFQRPSHSLGHSMSHAHIYACCILCWKMVKARLEALIKELTELKAVKQKLLEENAAPSVREQAILQDVLIVHYIKDIDLCLDLLQRVLVAHMRMLDTSTLFA